MTFEHLSLIAPILRALREGGYEKPTPIQSGAIPHALAGRDILGLAQTGTGKTAAFALPILQLLSAGQPAAARAPKALILAPTRELAIQINQSFIKYGRNLRLKTAVIYGGVGQGPQAHALARGVDILVATPGRLMDLMGQRLVTLNRVEFLILDEADRMLDMGFIRDVEKIVAALPRKRQSFFFSATMPPAVERLAAELLADPATVSVSPVSAPAERIDQKVMFVGRDSKDALLAALLKDQSIYRMLVFTKTKHKANRVAEKLVRGKISAEAIHGNKSQGARQRALQNFVKGSTRVLVATDIAARGIDITGISHVVNFELPNEPESYVHRIGRTARAGAGGVAISFCDKDEREYLRAIERVIRAPIAMDDSHPFHCAETAAARSGGVAPRPSNGGGCRRNARPAYAARNGRGAGGYARRESRQRWN
ncbi:MAG: DEAD/DEAH box helicase [Nitrospinae bacterium]|nr:DEAD/DEAH box helicase [Nitrospinota bacterium]